jgi:hypothetical protein
MLSACVKFLRISLPKGKPSVQRGDVSQKHQNIYPLVLDVEVIKRQATASQIRNSGTLHHVMILAINGSYIFLGDEGRVNLLGKTQLRK